MRAKLALKPTPDPLPLAREAHPIFVRPDIPRASHWIAPVSSLLFHGALIAVVLIVTYSSKPVEVMAHTPTRTIEVEICPNIPTTKKTIPVTAPEKPATTPVHTQPTVSRTAVKKSAIPSQQTPSRPTANHTASTAAVLPSSNSPSNVQQDYITRLLAQLERFKHYPDRARRLGQQGVAMVTFTLDAQGNITDYTIDQSTGSALLDQALHHMMQHATSLPPPPPAIAPRFTLPIRFNVQ